MTAPADHPTRAALLDAGLRLLGTRDPARISVNAITTEAQVAKGTYYVHFASREQYFEALHQWWHERLIGDIRAAVAGMPHGPLRLRHGIVAYLDSCQRHHAVKAAMIATRGRPSPDDIGGGAGPLLREIIEDLAAAGHPTPEQTAQLIAAMALDVAISEVRQSRADERLRTALLAMLPPGR